MGVLGLPPMAAVIRGRNARFRPLVDLTEAGKRARPPPISQKGFINSVRLRGYYHEGGNR